MPFPNQEGVIFCNLYLRYCKAVIFKMSTCFCFPRWLPLTGVHKVDPKHVDQTFPHFLSKFHLFVLETANQKCTLKKGSRTERFTCLFLGLAIYLFDMFHVGRLFRRDFSLFFETRPLAFFKSK